MTTVDLNLPVEEIRELTLAAKPLRYMLTAPGTATLAARRGWPLVTYSEHDGIEIGAVIAVAERLSGCRHNGVTPKEWRGVVCSVEEIGSTTMLVISLTHVIETWDVKTD